MVKPIKSIWIMSIACLAVLLSACANQASTTSSVPLKVETAVQESTDKTLAQPSFYYLDSAEKRLIGLEEHLKSDFVKSDASVYYYYNYVDLNEDLNNEVLVWTRTELENDDEESSFIIYTMNYDVIFRHDNGDPPIIVLSKKSNGWSDLAMFIGKGRYQRLVFDKKTYILLDNSKENVIEFNELVGQGYLADANNQKGFQIK